MSSRVGALEIIDPAGSGYHTFRIPSVLAHGSVVLAFCEGRLHGYRDAGALPAAAAARLDGVIGTAKSGGWQSAAESLYDFMLGQRREGADLPRAKPAKAPARRRT